MTESKLGAPLPAKQKRSQQTRDQLLAAGWRLLARNPWDQIGVNDIVAAAKSSVGSFYSRFADKESFFDSLALQYLERRRQSSEALIRELDPAGDYVSAVVMYVYDGVTTNRHFWFAAILKGVRVPGFWDPFRELGLLLGQGFLKGRSAQLGRALTAEEVRNIRFAFQMMNGVINNALINRPGPIMIETREFQTALVRGFRAVAGFEP